MKKKNILLYFTDQQRADTCGCYGQKLPITPVLDHPSARLRPLPRHVPDRQMGDGYRLLPQ